MKLNPDRYTHHFCQSSGFFLAFGIEASDFAILVIAIHSALCIFRPRTHLGETGLFGIRYLVYGLWITLPLLAAGLGLLQGGIYIDIGAFCWLPIRPFYYRLALSWIPRYIVFTTILFLYARIYWFVNHKFKTFHVHAGESYRIPSESAYASTLRSRGADSRVVGRKSISNDTTRSGKNSEYAMQEIRDISMSGAKGYISNDDQTPSSGPSWENYTFGSTTLPLPGPKADEITLAISQSSIGSPKKGSASTQKTTASDRSNEEVNKSLTDFLKEPPPEGMITASKLDQTLVIEEVSDETRVRQTAIKRQLRFMFVYPLVYLISWIPPLVQHFSLYNDDIASHPNFTLACVSTSFVALQCFFDSVIFCSRERPWRHVRKETSLMDIEEGQDDSHGSNTSRWFPFRPRTQQGSADVRSVPNDTTPATQSTPRNTPKTNTSRSSRPTTNRLSSASTKFSFKSPVGKSRGEMIAEARAARHRRELEASLARESHEERKKQRKDSALRRDGADRSWWEVEGRRRKDSIWLGLGLEAQRPLTPPLPTPPPSSSSSSRLKGHTSISERTHSPTSQLFHSRRLRGSGSPVNTPSILTPSIEVPPTTSRQGDDPSSNDGFLKPELLRADRAMSTRSITSIERRRSSMPTVVEEDGGS